MLSEGVDATAFWRERILGEWKYGDVTSIHSDGTVDVDSHKLKRVKPVVIHGDMGRRVAARMEAVRLVHRLATDQLRRVCETNMYHGIKDDAEALTYRLCQGSTTLSGYDGLQEMIDSEVERILTEKEDKS